MSQETFTLLQHSTAQYLFISALYHIFVFCDTHFAVFCVPFAAAFPLFLHSADFHFDRLEKQARCFVTENTFGNINRCNYAAFIEGFRLIVRSEGVYLVGIQPSTDLAFYSRASFSTALGIVQHCGF
jgi:hypothetical protein